MSDSMINVSAVGDTKLIAIFDELPENFNAAFMGRLTTLTEKLEGLVESNVTGAVQSRSGELAGSIRSGTKQGKDFIKGRVWSIAGAKAIALEYGAHGAGEVSAHTRRITTVFGKKLTAPTDQMVAAHSRTQNIAPHPFMRPAVEEISVEFTEKFQEALAEVSAIATAEMS